MNETTATPRPVPAWQQRLQQTLERLNAWWSQREPRERRLLKIGGLLVVIALLWLLGVKPALTRIAQADQRLPGLQATALQVDAVVREAQALRRGQTGVIPAAELTPALQVSLQRAGLAEQTQLTETDASFDGARQWTVQVENASASRVIEWLAEAPLNLRLQARSVDLSRARIDGRDRPGSVSGTIVLATAQEQAS